MKIALFVPSWPPGSTASGIVTYASQLVPALRQLGHEVFVVTISGPTDDRDPYTIDLRRLKAGATFWTRAMSRVAPEAASFNMQASAIASGIHGLVERYALDVFEIEESFGWSYRASSLKLLPIVIKLHGPWFLNERFEESAEWRSLNRRRTEREGRALQRAQLVIAPSATVLQAVRNYYDFDLAETRVIPNPLDAVGMGETWDAETCDKDSLLFVGRFDALKGGDLVLQAFAELATTYPRLKMIFVGPDKGIKGANGIMLPFEQFVRSGHDDWYRPRIEFCGTMTHANVMALRTRCFATIVASRHENFPYSVLEAMSLGCPVVATAVGGIPELIKDGQNGLLAPYQDVRAIVAACRKLLDDRAFAARIGRQAWRDCRELYGSENIARQAVAAYQEAIDRFKLQP